MSTPGEPVPPIASARLDLVSLPVAFMEAVLAGETAAAEAILGSRIPAGWSDAVSDLFRYRLGQLKSDPTQLQWLARAMVLRDRDRTVIGHIGFHGPPDERGMVEVGYTVMPDYRRQGYAREAVLALFDWAGREHGITLFRASVGPWNEPSLGLVRSLGFQQTGVQWDDVDGEELVFEVVIPRPGAAAG
jgi:RimJ/RimL family protein N-acetyltransferase